MIDLQYVASNIIRTLPAEKVIRKSAYSRLVSDTYIKMYEPDGNESVNPLLAKVKAYYQKNLAGEFEMDIETSTSKAAAVVWFFSAENDNYGVKVEIVNTSCGSNYGYDGFWFVSATAFYG